MTGKKSLQKNLPRKALFMYTTNSGRDASKSEGGMGTAIEGEFGNILRDS